MQVRGRLPLVSYWHDWRMDVRDPATRQSLANIRAITFDQESGRFSFELPDAKDWQRPAGQQVELMLSGQFGFDTVLLDTVRMALPWPDAATAQAALGGWRTLISGEHASLAPHDEAAAACLDDLTLSNTEGTVVARNPAPQASLSADLQAVPPGPLTLVLHQAGQDPLSLPVQVLQPQAQVTRIEHAEGEDSLSVQGQRLERIARIDVPGRGSCTPSDDASAANPTRMAFACEGNIRRNASLPATVQVIHQGDEPGPLTVRLTPTAAIPRLALAANTPNALLVSPSDKAIQWGLPPGDVLMSEDSGLSLLLQAQSPYVLSKGSYTLQLRFQDDPETDSRPLSAPLIADFAHNELRTRSPVRFDPAHLPSIVNPLQWRVLHQPSGQAGPWQDLGRTLIWLPDLQSLSCSASGDALLLGGQRMDLIDALRIAAGSDAADKAFTPPELAPCAQGLCLRLPRRVPGDLLQLRLRWLDDRVFSVQLPKANRACP